jgi:hypothetical protein
LRLFNIYAAGNFIACTIDTPYLQIGEHKYGKPILDRAVTFDTELYDALKIGLIAMDSTTRSNLGVGLPIDIAVARRDASNRNVGAHRCERSLCSQSSGTMVVGPESGPHRHSAPPVWRRWQSLRGGGERRRKVQQMRHRNLRAAISSQNASRPISRVLYGAGR